MPDYPRRKLSISLALTVPSGMSDTKAVQLLNYIIKMAYADMAVKAARSNDPQADSVSSLQIGTPKIVKDS